MADPPYGAGTRDSNTIQRPPNSATERVATQTAISKTSFRSGGGV